MVEVQATSELNILLPGEFVFPLIADFEHHTWKVLPNAVSEFHVVAGGYGDGTELTCRIRLGGWDQPCAFRFSEPIRGKVLTGFETRSRSMVTWRIRDMGRNCRVELDVVAVLPVDFPVIRARILFPISLRKLIADTLANLNRYALSLAPPSPESHP